MRTKHLFTLAVTVLLCISTLSISAQATVKPHGSPARPKTDAVDNWRED